MVAAHLGAVPIEVDADRSTPAAACARPTMTIRRELGLLDGRGGHRRSSTRGRASASRCPRPPPPCPAGSIRVRGIFSRATQTARRPRVSRRGPPAMLVALDRPVSRCSSARAWPASRRAPRRRFSRAMRCAQNATGERRSWRLSQVRARLAALYRYCRTIMRNPGQLRSHVNSMSAQDAAQFAL
jgi:hypothetical protein